MIESTIDPDVPATGGGFSSAVVRGQFQAARNDINQLWSALNAVLMYLSGLSPAGFQQLSSLATSQHLTVPVGATVAILTVAGAPVRYLDNGSVPTATTGMPIPVNASIFYTGPLSEVQFIEQSVGAILDVAYYTPNQPIQS